jgi:hypothetical protein
MKQSVWLHYAHIHLTFFICNFTVYMCGQRADHTLTLHVACAQTARGLRADHAWASGADRVADSARWVEKRPRFARSARRQNRRPRVVCAFQQGTLLTHHLMREITVVWCKLFLGQLWSTDPFHLGILSFICERTQTRPPDAHIGRFLWPKNELDPQKKE